MKLKQELEEKIKNEERQMNLLNKTLNDYQQQEEFLIRKIQSTKIDLKESSPGRQTFSRMRTNSTEK